MTGLTLEIEFLDGTCRAARGPDDPTPDWPPQPDRIFSALVAAWAARGERTEEEAALEWLEGQEPPQIAAGRAHARTAPRVYVPPNDARESSNEEKYLHVLPEHRKRQPRRFPVARLDEPTMRLRWTERPPQGVLAALDAIARDTPSIGHSASFTRCRFHTGSVAEQPTAPARRTIYPGRLAELKNAHRADPARPTIRAGTPVIESTVGEKRPTGGSWLVLEHIAGTLPNPRAAALVSDRIRAALMSGYRRTGRANTIPSMVSRHAPDGAPAHADHIAIAPMLFAGEHHADGHVLGFSLIPPRGMDLEQIEGLVDAFEAIAPYHRRRRQRVLTLTGAPLGAPVTLGAVRERARAGTRALSPEPYLGRSLRWATTTPMVLERHRRRGTDDETQALIALACEHAGLGAARDADILASAHSALRGPPCARPPPGAPAWLRWQLPRRLASRELTHAVITFAEPVAGPVLLGAGRYSGLGLCRRLTTLDGR